MELENLAVRRALARVVVVAGCGILAGYLLYGRTIVAPRMRAFEFFVNSVSISLTYAALKSTTVRNTAAVLFVWYVALIGLSERPTFRFLELHLTYVGMMSLATYGLLQIARTRMGRTAFQRIVLAGVTISVANGLADVIMGILSFPVILAHVETWAKGFLLNLQLGALIGLSTGCGMECAEVILRRFVEPRHESQ